MGFGLTSEQQAVADLARRVAADFSDRYWAEHDRTGVFPHDFHAAIAAAGLLGVAMPPEYGGAGLGMTEAALVMEAIAGSGAGMSGASAVHINIFGLHPVVLFGTPEQRARMLPPLIAGREKACFAVTEPDAGLDTAAIRTRADRVDGGYRIHGQKTWISTAQVATRVLLLARTAPSGTGGRRAGGLSLFYTALDRARCEIRPIAKMGRHAVDSNQLFFDGMDVPEADRIGPEGDGFRLILSGMNAERILMAAEAVGLGRAAIARAADYARDRVVFGRPIGQNQGIQHPLARAWMHLEGAWAMVLRAAAIQDAGLPCGTEANTAKYLAAEAAFLGCETAVQTMGGVGYAADYTVERLMRECFIPRIAPVSPQMILNFIAEKTLGLPRSY
jgi:acyl-CoA dehydrogenase